MWTGPRTRLCSHQGIFTLIQINLLVEEELYNTVTNSEHSRNIAVYNKCIRKTNWLRKRSRLCLVNCNYNISWQYLQKFLNFFLRTQLIHGLLIMLKKLHLFNSLFSNPLAGHLRRSMLELPAIYQSCKIKYLEGEKYEGFFKRFAR